MAVQTDHLVVPSAVQTVEATAQEFLNVAWESQEQAMDETGEVDPKTIY